MDSSETDAQPAPGVTGAISRYAAARRAAMQELPNARELTELASRIRSHTLKHLLFYLEQFARTVETHGGRVHFAADAKDANRIVRDIAERTGCGRVVMAESPLLHEIGLRPAVMEPGAPAELAVATASFLVAETGQACFSDETANVQKMMLLAQTTVTIAGIDAVVPRLADLAVMLKLLGRSSRGVAMTAYTSLYGGREGFHVVLLDLGRSQVLRSEFTDALKCIQCGACLDVCPVNHRDLLPADARAYSGPIGAVIAPLVDGLAHHLHLPAASTLCGACYEVCPVKVDIPQYLVRLRRQVVLQRLEGKWRRLWHWFWAHAMTSVWGYRMWWWHRRRAEVNGPVPSVTRSFRTLWKRRRRLTQDVRHG